MEEEIDPEVWRRIQKISTIMATNGNCKTTLGGKVKERLNDRR